MNPLRHVLSGNVTIGPIPDRKEFESWTIRGRHDFIKRQYGKEGLRISSPGDWCYLIYRSRGYAIRFKLNRRREIYSVEVTDADRCWDSIRQSELADRAIHSKN